AVQLRDRRVPQALPAQWPGRHRSDPAGRGCDPRLRAAAPSGPALAVWRQQVRPAAGGTGPLDEYEYMSKKILVLPGDGIGPEIVAEAVKVLQLVGEKYALSLELSYDDLGGAAYDRYGTPLADETLERARQADAVLLGAVGGPKWDT